MRRHALPHCTTQHHARGREHGFTCAPVQCGLCHGQTQCSRRQAGRGFLAAFQCGRRCTVRVGHSMVAPLQVERVCQGRRAVDPGGGGVAAAAAPRGVPCGLALGAALPHQVGGQGAPQAPARPPRVAPFAAVASIARRSRRRIGGGVTPAGLLGPEGVGGPGYLTPVTRRRTCGRHCYGAAAAAVCCVLGWGGTWGAGRSDACDARGGLVILVACCCCV